MLCVIALFAQTFDEVTGHISNATILMVVAYGTGRFFHTTMGHGLAALNCIGFMITYQRGTE
jgi:hypothetical protein